jgi:hypothetical protein
LLALAALAYLALLALRPDLAARMIYEAPFGTPEGNQGQRATFRALAEIQELKGTTSRLQAEIQALRAAATAEHTRVEALEARLAVLERRQVEQTPVADSSAAVATPSVASAAPKAAGEPAAAPPKFAASTAPALRDASPIETQALPAPKAPPVAVVVASGASLDAVRLTWQLLQESNRTALRGLEPRYQTTAGDPPAYQLLAGPVSSREAAKRLCERLRSRQSPCSIVPYAGQPL